MIEKNIKKFKNLLLKEREKILVQLDFDKEQIEDLYKKEIGDMVDRAFNDYEKARTIQMSEQEKKYLAAIDEALVRIDKKVFGECMVCGELLTLKRLNALPWAATCVDPSTCKRRKKKIETQKKH